jgi:hypothetical protein
VAEFGDIFAYQLTETVYLSCSAAFFIGYALVAVACIARPEFRGVQPAFRA